MNQTTAAFAAYLAQNPSQAVHFWPAWSDYIPVEPTPKQLAFLMLTCREAFYGGAAGGGKLLPLGGLILTPFGWKKCEDLRKGDAVNNPDGSIGRIIQLHPIVKLPKYTVYFHDGTRTEVAAEHLWLAWRSGIKKKIKNEPTFGEPGAEVIETQELKKWVDAAIEQQSKGLRPNWPCIPICKEQPFNITLRYKSNLDPYFLGLLLGDGSITPKNINLTSIDHKHLEKELRGYEYTHKGKAYNFRGETLKTLRHELSRLGLLGTYSNNKFIPYEFLWGSIETRYSILQGLLDTDGTVDARGQVYYTTVSLQLAKDVKHIVESLGGTATVFEKPFPFYRDTNGDKVVCQKAYTLYIKHRDESKLFRLARKKARTKPTGNMYRRVVKIEKKGTVVGRCLTVSHPNGLYITNDFIVTHNSIALLMSALQYVDVPGYSALILRRSFKDLSQPGALIDVSQQWLGGTPARWNSQQHQWIFPSGAVLQFGYIGDANASQSYQGAQYTFIGFDELAQHRQSDYLYLFSRLRRLVCSVHQLDAKGRPIYKDDCPECKVRRAVPTRVRATSNPPRAGDEGRFENWVKRRFSIQKALQGAKTIFRGMHPNRIYIPAFLQDNPFIDQEGYIESLKELDPVTREQLLNGDWNVTADGRFKRKWARWYSRNGEYIIMGPNRKGTPYLLRNCLVFQTVDPAASVKAGPWEKEIWVKREPSSTVISTWAMTPEYDLCWLDMEKFQVEIPEIFPRLTRAFKKHNPQFIGIESNGINKGVYQMAQRMGLPIQSLNPGSDDKLVRATTAAVRMEAGQIFFPSDNPNWLEEVETDLYTWSGHPHEAADVVDTLAYAAKYVGAQSLTKESQGGSIVPMVY